MAVKCVKFNAKSKREPEFDAWADDVAVGGGVESKVLTACGAKEIIHRQAALNAEAKWLRSQSGGAQ
jgi:hypothetical protein